MYRILRRDAVVKGGWYYAVKCKKCGEPIFMLVDITNGKKPVPMAGDGKISTPCPKCLNEAVFDPSDIKSTQANEDLPGTRPTRTLASPSRRQPFLSKYPKARATFGAGYIEDRPLAGSIVARIVTMWADIEVQCGQLLASFLNTDIRGVAAVFGSLRSSRAQQDALGAVADVHLGEKDRTLFAAYMARKATLEKERNDLAHGCFGTSPTVPNDVLWVSQTDRLQHMARVASEGIDAAYEWLQERVYVYELGTLERVAQEFEEYYGQLGSLVAYVRSAGGDMSSRERRYSELAAQTHISEIMVRLAKNAT
jgi:hypothetical protein